MEEKNYKILDEAVYSTIVLLNKLSGEDGIYLSNFREKDKSHLCLMQIASMMKLWGQNLYINCNVFKYLKLKFKYRKNISMKFSAQKEVSTCDYIVSKLETLFHKGILEEVYEEYYGK